MAVDIRQVIQELVVPELKDLRGAVDRVQVEIKRLDEKSDALRNELTVKIDACRTETVAEIRRLDERIDNLDSKLGAKFDSLDTKIGALDERLSEAIDIRERLAALEARVGKRTGR